MISFKNDYSEGAHPQILEALFATNMTQLEGYGEDELCEQARDFIRREIGDEKTAIYFVSGGTQANTIVITSMLRPHEAVISAKTGHINVHEAGAIESTGHKVEPAMSVNGKLTPEAAQAVLDAFEDHHMVKPGAVYISNTTELGTVYTLAEIEALSAFCKANDLYFFLDGARLGSALVGSDVSMKDIARLVDVFYIGGTKNGALLGEAIVILNDALKTDFEFLVKQRGALLSKGRVLGIQFLELFRDGLFYELAEHANKMALKLASGIAAAGHDFLTPPASNQIFPILPNALIKKLKEDFSFYVWKKVDEESSAIRLVTSWATQEENVDAFLEAFQSHSRE